MKQGASVIDEILAAKNDYIRGFGEEPNIIRIGGKKLAALKREARYQEDNAPGMPKLATILGMELQESDHDELVVLLK